MTDTNRSQTASHPVACARIIALLILVCAFIFIFSHDRLPAIPMETPTPDVMGWEGKSIAAEAMRSMVELLVALAFGLTAIVGFSIKDGFKGSPKLEAAATLLVSLFLYFVVRVMVYAYDIHGAIAEQSAVGSLLPGFIEGSLELQARSLIYAAAISFIVLVCRVLRSDE